MTRHFYVVKICLRIGLQSPIVANVRGSTTRAQGEAGVHVPVAVRLQLGAQRPVGRRAAGRRRAARARQEECNIILLSCTYA